MQKTAFNCIVPARGEGDGSRVWVWVAVGEKRQRRGHWANLGISGGVACPIVRAPLCWLRGGGEMSCELRRAEREGIC